MQKSLSYFWLVLNPRPSEQKTLLNSLFRLHLIITSNYRGKKVSCKYHDDSTKLLCKTCAYCYRIVQDQESNTAQISVISSAGLHSI